MPGMVNTWQRARLLGVEATRSSLTTYVNEAGLIPLAQVVQDRWLTEVSQLSHVSNFVEFLWVDGLCISLRDNQSLKG